MQKAVLMLDLMKASKSVKRLTLFIELLGELARSEEWKYLASIAYSPVINSKHEDRINHVFGFLHEHLTEELLLPQVASECNMSPESFSRFFKKTTGKTFIGFLTELRISNACWLLQQSDMTITEICYDCGFTNLSNFNRRFRKFKMLTPSEYRKASRIGSVAKNEVLSA